MSTFNGAMVSVLDDLKKKLGSARAVCDAKADEQLEQGSLCSKYELMRSALPDHAKGAIGQLHDQLGHPSACTREEITMVVRDHLAVNANEFENAFARAITLLNQLCSVRLRSEPFILGSGLLHFHQLDEIEPLWEFQSASCVGQMEVCGYSHQINEHQVGDDEYFVENPTTEGLEEAGVVAVRSRRLEARLRARCSRGAMASLENTFRNIAPSLFRSAALLEHARNSQDYEKWSAEFHEWFQTSEDEVFDGDMKDGPDPIVVFDRSGKLGSGFLWIRGALNAYFGTGGLGKKDTFEKRIRNAVVLLAESDTQSNSAIRLALCVTALEALLGKRGSDISRTLQENIATLLEPDPDQKLDAERFVKKLYDHRSQVLHGESVDNRNDKTVFEGRLLAAAALRAFVERIQYARRSGEGVETPEQLLSDLKSRKYKPGHPTGVLESPVRVLWTDEHGN